MVSPSRLGPWLSCVASLVFGCAAAHGARPRPDPEAMREAVAQSREARYASSRAYAHFVRAVLARSGEDLATAVEELRLAVLFDPESAYLRVALAELLGRTGAWAKAQGELDEALRLDPGHVPAWLEQGRQLAERRRPREAQKAFERVIALAPRDPQGYLLLAQVHLDEGEEAKAIAAIEALGRALPGEPRGFKVLGRHLVQQHRPAQALPLLRKAARLDPSDAESARLLARALEQTGEVEEAVTHLEQALARAGGHDPELLFALATLLERRGELEGALARMRELLAQEPENADALNFVGYALAQQGRGLEEAEQLVRRALAAEPDNGAYLDSLGWILFKRGALQPALGVLEQAQALLPGEPVVAEHLGDVYLALARRTEAAQAYRRAVEGVKRALGAGPWALGNDGLAQCERVEAKLRAAGGVELAGGCGKLTSPGKRP